MAENAQKCKHPSCTCMVKKGEKYCSEYCHDAGSTMEISCNCRHAGCSMEESVKAGRSTPVAAGSD
jgi:hypothetical protein